VRILLVMVEPGSQNAQFNQSAQVIRRQLRLNASQTA
jgi:hypothetical protein